MPERQKSTPLDLTRYTETTRRELYDRVVLLLWTREDSGDYIPDFTPDQCGLTVSYSHGRWLLAYRDLEEPDTAPPDQREVVSRIHSAPDRRFGIQLSEV